MSSHHPPISLDQLLLDSNIRNNINHKQQQRQQEQQRRRRINTIQNTTNPSESQYCTVFDHQPQHLSSPIPEEQYGWSIAISHDGCRIAIGTFHEPGIVYLFDKDGVWLRTITNPYYSSITTSWNGWLPTINDDDGHGRSKRTGFGTSLALNCDGSRLVIGTLDVGLVYLFDTIHGDLLQTYKAPQPPSGIGEDKDKEDNKDNIYTLPSRFGESVDINCNGTQIVIGDSNQSFQGITGAGQVSLFNDVGQLLQTFHSPIPHQYEEFGSAVAISAGWKGGTNNQRIIVGSAWSELGSNTNFSAYAYLFDTQSGTFLQAFEKPNSVVGKKKKGHDGFGYDVDISCKGDKVLIGSRFDSTHFDEGGAAYLFVNHNHQGNDDNNSSNNVLNNNNNNNTEQTKFELYAKIFPPHSSPGDQFGGSVSMDCQGDRILVANYGDGSAHLYEFSTVTTTSSSTTSSTTTGPLLARPILLDTWKVPINHEYSGASVALSGNGQYAAIGAPRAHGDGPHLTRIGAAYLACLEPPPEQNSNVYYNNTTTTVYPPFQYEEFGGGVCLRQVPSYGGGALEDDVNNLNSAMILYLLTVLVGIMIWLQYRNHRLDVQRRELQRVFRSAELELVTQHHGSTSSSSSNNLHFYRDEEGN